MREDVKQAWMKALNSDDYKQGRGRLQNFIGEMCCLGVLVRVVQEEFPDLAATFTITPPNGTCGLQIDYLEASLPESLWRAIRAKEDQAVYWHMNDSEGRTFAQIAMEIAVRE